MPATCNLGVLDFNDLEALAESSRERFPIIKLGYQQCTHGIEEQHRTLAIFLKSAISVLGVTVSERSASESTPLRV